MTCVYLGLVPWTTNTTPGAFDEQRFQKGGLKGALVVVEANAVGVCVSLTRRQARRLATRVTSFRAYEGQLSYDGWPFFS